MTQTRPFWVAGKPVTSDEVSEIRSPYDGDLVATLSIPTAGDVEAAVSAADATRCGIDACVGADHRAGR